MKREKTQNLPVFVYRLAASVVLVKDGLGYELRSYSFETITIKSNHPLRPGDCVDSSSCHFGNENIEIIPHLISRRELGDICEELQYYYGCEITCLTQSFVDPENPHAYQSCGTGKCRVFIELSASKISAKFREIDESFGDFAELTPTRRLEYDQISDEYDKSRKIDYWKNRAKKWDENIIEIGEVPKDLMY